MLEKIAKIVKRYDEIERVMADPEVLADYQKLAELAQERSELASIVNAYHEHEAVVLELEDTRELLAAADDPEMIAMAEEEI